MDLSTSRYAPTGEQKLTTSSAGGEATHSDSLKSYLDRAKFDLELLKVTSKPSSKASPNRDSKTDAKLVVFGASLSSTRLHSDPSAALASPHHLHPSLPHAPTAITAEGKTVSASHSVADRQATFKAAVHQKAAEVSKGALLRPDEFVKIPRRTSSFNPEATKWSPQSQLSSNTQSVSPTPPRGDENEHTDVVEREKSNALQAKSASSRRASLPVSALPYTLRSSSLQPSAVIANTDSAMDGPNFNGLRGGTDGLSSSRYASNVPIYTANNSSSGLGSSRYASNQPPPTANSGGGGLSSSKYASNEPLRTANSSGGGPGSGRLASTEPLPTASSSGGGLASSRYATTDTETSVRGGFSDDRQSSGLSNPSPFANLGVKVSSTVFPKATNTGHWRMPQQYQGTGGNENVAPSQQFGRTENFRLTKDVDGMYSGFATLRSDDRGENSVINSSNRAGTDDIKMAEADVVDSSIGAPRPERVRSMVRKNFLTSIQDSIIKDRNKGQQQARLNKKNIQEKIRALDAGEATSTGHHNIYASERAQFEAARMHRSHEDRLEIFRGFVEPKSSEYVAPSTSATTPFLPAAATSVPTLVAPTMSQPMPIAEAIHDEEMTDVEVDMAAIAEAQTLMTRVNQDIEASNKVLNELLKFEKEHERCQAGYLDRLQKLKFHSTTLLTKNEGALREAVEAAMKSEEEFETQSKKYEDRVEDFKVLSRQEMDAITSSDDLPERLNSINKEKTRVATEINAAFQAKDRAMKALTELRETIKELSAERDANNKKTNAIDTEGRALWNVIAEAEETFVTKQELAENYVISMRQDVIGVVLRIAELLGLHMPAEHYKVLGLTDEELQAFYIRATPRERTAMDILSTRDDAEYATMQAGGGSMWAKGLIITTEDTATAGESLPEKHEATISIESAAVQSLRGGEGHKKTDSTDSTKTTDSANSLSKQMAELTIDNNKTEGENVELKDQVFFKAWPQPEARNGGPAQIRRVKLNGFPSTANLTKVAALVWGGKVQKFMYVPGCTTAEILFLKHEDAMNYYNETSNGVSYPDIPGLWILPALYSDVDPVFESVEGMIERGDTRVLRVLKIGNEWSTAALGKIAQGTRRTLQVEKVWTGTDRYGHRFVEFRMAGIQDAIVLKAELERNTEWEGTVMQFGEDPCETSKGVHVE